LRLVAQGFAGIQAATVEADALLAVCAEAAGNTVERDRALARTRTLRVGIKARQEVYFVDIALAKVDGTAHADAAAHLHALALAAVYVTRSAQGYLHNSQAERCGRSTPQLHQRKYESGG
jgi:hypothetical protein